MINHKAVISTNEVLFSPSDCSGWYSSSTSVAASCFQNSLNKINLYYVKSYLRRTGCSAPCQTTNPFSETSSSLSLILDRQSEPPATMLPLHVGNVPGRLWWKGRTRQEHSPEQREAVGLGKDSWAWRLNGQQGSIAWGSGEKQCPSSWLRVPPWPRRAHNQALCAQWLCQSGLSLLLLWSVHRLPSSHHLTWKTKLANHSLFIYKFRKRICIFFHLIRRSQRRASKILGWSAQALHGCDIHSLAHTPPWASQSRAHSSTLNKTGKRGL